MINDVDWSSKKNTQLVKAILALENEKEAESFLRDLMTKKEIYEFANRLEAAKLLSKNVQYNTIIEDTGLSSTTIARISKWLKSTGGGYRSMLTKLASRKNSHHSNPNQLRRGLS